MLLLLVVLVVLLEMRLDGVQQQDGSEQWQQQQGLLRELMV